MTMIKFVARTPSDHHEIARGKYSFVPRQGDMVTLDDRTRYVHSVVMDLTKNSVTVYLDE